jgi:heat shock protein HspQ
MFTTRAKYHLGQIVRHRKHPFRGVVFDVDPQFSNTDEWYDAIPEGHPDLPDLFGDFENGRYPLQFQLN